MWFDKSMDGIYDNAIEPAVKATGYDPYRIDRDPHNERITDKVIAEIRASKFLIADFTTERKNNVRGNVYYEAGFAHGLKTPVIFMCRKDKIKNIHFDTQQFNHIAWKNEEDLKEQLTERILSRIRPRSSIPLKSRLQNHPLTPLTKQQHILVPENIKPAFDGPVPPQLLLVALAAAVHHIFHDDAL